MLIRRAEPADAEVWLTLRTALRPSDDHRAEIAAFFEGGLDEPDEVLLAFDAGRPVALVELSIRHDVEGAIGVRTDYVEGLYVTPEARSGGTSRALIDAARRWATQQGCSVLASDRAGRAVLFRNPSLPRL